ncbi:dihydrodipicolinate synthase family protein [Glaciimonas sp. PCH181]|uniref:dihydrodipicolinate synthase family protein n=1 Tax=Glaciimonas sp. PCH181 TaxID=2133943 RepID=UPI000D366856|nr:dihydrodipicolinate synthase family protein [Glaciimonas sp. PCH181]PUA20369.1 dihydrodipicolinate synthase family protein [Glaciimonas sp. PCH181]
MSTLKLHGIIPPVVTPLTHDYKVDKPSLRRVIRHLLDGGVHGLFLLGSTSEVVFLNAQQRADVMEVAVAEAGGRVPLVAGVIDPTTDRTIEYARQAKELGVDGLVVTSQFYTRTSQAETVDHFSYIKDAVDLPIIAYDIPVCVQLKLARETIRELYDRKIICAVKDSSGDDGNMRMLMRDFAEQPDFAILTGSETMVDYALLGGAHGNVPGLGNVDPAGYVRLYNAAKAGDWETARAEQHRLIALFDIVFQGVPHTSPNASGVGGFKTAMHLMGLIENRHMSRPNRVLPDAAIEKIRAILVSAGLL